MQITKVFACILSIFSGLFILIAVIHYFPYVQHSNTLPGWILHCIAAISAILGALLLFRKPRLGGCLILGAGSFTTIFAVIYNHILIFYPFFFPYSFFMQVLAPPIWIFGMPIEAVLLLFVGIVVLLTPMTKA